MYSRYKDPSDKIVEKTHEVLIFVALFVVKKMKYK